MNTIKSILFLALTLAIFGSQSLKAQPNLFPGIVPPSIHTFIQTLHPHQSEIQIFAKLADSNFYVSNEISYSRFLKRTTTFDSLDWNIQNISTTWNLPLSHGFSLRGSQMHSPYHFYWHREKNQEKSLIHHQFNRTQIAQQLLWTNPNIQAGLHIQLGEEDRFGATIHLGNKTHQIGLFAETQQSEQSIDVYLNDFAPYTPDIQSYLHHFSSQYFQTYYSYQNPKHQHSLTAQLQLRQNDFPLENINALSDSGWSWQITGEHHFIGISRLKAQWHLTQGKNITQGMRLTEAGGQKRFSWIQSRDLAQHAQLDYHPSAKDSTKGWGLGYFSAKIPLEAPENAVNLRQELISYNRLFPAGLLTILGSSYARNGILGDGKVEIRQLNAHWFWNWKLLNQKLNQKNSTLKFQLNLPSYYSHVQAKINLDEVSAGIFTNTRENILSETKDMELWHLAPRIQLEWNYLQTLKLQAYWGQFIPIWIQIKNDPQAEKRFQSEEQAWQMFQIGLKTTLFFH